MNRISVLDVGYVELIDHMGGDISIVEAAQESTAFAKRTSGPEKLITYLMKHGHTSPFEQVEFKFRIKAPLVPVIYQIVRHRTAHLNQVSGRYGEFPEEFYVPAGYEIHKQHPMNKQMSATAQVDPEIADNFRRSLMGWQQDGYALYMSALAAGISRETARFALAPTIYSELMWKIDMHNLFGFLAKRQHETAQIETRAYADAIFTLAKPIAPFTFALFDMPAIRNVYRHAIDS